MARSVTAPASSGSGEAVVFVHHAREQSLIERAPIHADAHRPVILDGRFDHDAEIIVVLLADIYIARIDAVLGQGARHFRVFLQQNVAVVMEVADDGNAAAELVQGLDDARHRARGLLRVDRDAHQLRASLRQRHHLVDRRGSIGGVGVGHGLDHDGIVPADQHRARSETHGHSHRAAARTYSHSISSRKSYCSLPPERTTGYRRRDSAHGPVRAVSRLFSTPRRAASEPNVGRSAGPAPPVRAPHRQARVREMPGCFARLLVHHRVK